MSTHGNIAHTITKSNGETLFILLPAAVAIRRPLVFKYLLYHQATVATVSWLLIIELSTLLLSVVRNFSFTRRFVSLGAVI